MAETDVVDYWFLLFIFCPFLDFLFGLLDLHYWSLLNILDETSRIVSVMSGWYQYRKYYEEIQNISTLTWPNVWPKFKVARSPLSFSSNETTSALFSQDLLIA